MHLKGPVILCLLLGLLIPANAQRHLNSGHTVRVVPDNIIHIRFDKPLRDWQGFGVNYVQAVQTRDYTLFPQDFSGFSFASEENRQQIMEMIFGVEGLRPGLTKLFLDPFHEGMTKTGNDNDDPMVIHLEGYDHQSTTKWIRYFNRMGLKMMQEWGGSFTSIATLYGPAPWMTRQKYLLGRDVDPEERYELAEYMVSWAKYLIEREGIPVKYISFHNEGDAYYRWPRDGSSPGEDHRDYNLYWPPEQVVDFLKITREVLDANKMNEVGLASGETQSWYRFDQWGYARALVDDPEALKNLDLITSHSFANLDIPNSVYYGDFRSTGQDLVHNYKPEVPIWVTSRPWDAGPDYVENVRRDIYECKANGLIPWALIEGDREWLTSDGTYRNAPLDKPFVIHKDGSLTITDNYFYLKQLFRAGQAGMKVADVICFNPALGAIAFKAMKDGQQDAFVLVNKSDETMKLSLYLHGSQGDTYTVYRTMEGERYKELENARVRDGVIIYECPARSVSTFFSTFY